MTPEEPLGNAGVGRPEGVQVRRGPSPQLPSVVRTELPAPLPDGFVRHDDSSFGKQILDIPELMQYLW